jgi:transcriptional regulatory protein LevR
MLRELITTDHPLKLTVYGNYKTIFDEMIKHKNENKGFVYLVDHCSLTELVLLVCTHDNHSKPSKEITLYV